jgi:hypothetical protein
VVLCVQFQIPTYREEYTCCLVHFVSMWGRRGRGKNVTQSVFDSLDLGLDVRPCAGCEAGGAGALAEVQYMVRSTP